MTFLLAIILLRDEGDTFKDLRKSVCYNLSWKNIAKDTLERLRQEGYTPEKSEMLRYLAEQFPTEAFDATLKTFLNLVKNEGTTTFHNAIKHKDTISK